MVPIDRTPVVRVSLFRAIAILAGVALLLFSGCSGSSPRFTTPSARSQESGDDDETRFASKIRDEETREDDRRADIPSLKKKYSAPSRAPENALAPPGLSRDAVLLDVVSFLGAPYRYGGFSKSGIDCSGFTARVYEHAAGIVLPRSAEGQFHCGKSVGRDDLRFGDLVFFNTTGSSPSHVGIYIEDDLFAHASVSTGVTFSSLQSSYYTQRFVGARRVVR
jgi:cell wall-associated NlpC family hydrolase